MKPTISYTLYTSTEQTQKVKQMAASKFNNNNKKATAASYKVAKLIAQHGKLFPDGEFTKQCLMKRKNVPKKSAGF